MDKDKSYILLKHDQSEYSKAGELIVESFLIDSPMTASQMSRAYFLILMLTSQAIPFVELGDVIEVVNALSYELRRMVEMGLLVYDPRPQATVPGQTSPWAWYSHKLALEKAEVEAEDGNAINP